MMVMVDNNFLISLLTKPDMYRLYNQLMERGQMSIGLPTPVLAEFLVKDNNLERTNFLNKTNAFLQIFDFDQKSARASAGIMQALIAKGYFERKLKNKQVIKVDIQILGIVVANQIRQLFTTDKEISKIIDLLGLPVEVIDFAKEEYQGMSLFEGLE